MSASIFNLQTEKEKNKVIEAAMAAAAADYNSVKAKVQAKAPPKVEKKVRRRR